MIDWDSIKNEYILSGGKILLKDLAAKYGIKDSTVRSRKNREKWDEELNDSVATQQRNVANKKLQKSCNNTEEISEETVDGLSNCELTEKQRFFCIYYIEDFNATKAYQKAYDSDYETARRCGSRLLTNVDVKLEIEKLTKECLNEKEINSKFLAKRLLQKYIDIAFANIADFVKFGRKELEISKKEDGEPVIVEVNYVDFKNSSEVDGTIISEIKQGKDGASIKLQDKMKALDFLAKNIGLLDIATQQKLEIEKRKMALLEKQADDLDEDIEYVIEDDASEKKED